MRVGRPRSVGRKPGAVSAAPGFRIDSPELFSKLQSEARQFRLELKLVNNSAPRAERVVKKFFSLQGLLINELPSEGERAG
jgi:hypothetical protein